MKRAMGLAALLAAVSAPLAAQGTCEFNNQSSCTVGADATHAITITITPAARLSVASVSVQLPGPSASSFTTGFGDAAGVGTTVRSNTSWAVTIFATDALWTALPVSARQDKPASDLQFATALGGPFTDISTSPQSLRSGGATGTEAFTLYLRTKYAFTLDSPGTYSIPLNLVISAP